MPYCFKCGVEVNNGVGNCPLCKMDLPIIEDEVVIEPRYPAQENVFREIKKRRRNVFFAIYSMIIIAIAFNLALIDRRTNGILEWSQYPTIYLLGSIFYVFAILQFSKNEKINFSLIGLTTIVLLYLTDMFNGEIDWFLKLGVPISVISTIVLYFLFKILTRKKLLPYKVMEIIVLTAIFLIILELIIDKYLFDKIYLGWSIQAFVCFLPLMTILIFMPRRLYEKIDKYVERKIHL